MAGSDNLFAAGVPCVRGIFVLSHINAVRKAKGNEGVRLLERGFGKSLDFDVDDLVPVRDELKIIDAALHLTSVDAVPAPQVDYEAGKLHFRNFSTTTLGKTLLLVFRDDFKFILLRTPAVARLVFSGMSFSATDLGPNSVRVCIRNCAYPLEHFHGIFSEWMSCCGIRGAVETEKLGVREYSYLMRWL